MSRTLSGMFLVGASTRLRKRKKDQPGKSQKIGQVPKRTIKDKKRTDTSTLRTPPRLKLPVDNWKLPSYNGAFLLIVVLGIFSAYSWSSLTYSWTFLLTAGAFLLTAPRGPRMGRWICGRWIRVLGALIFSLEAPNPYFEGFRSNLGQNLRHPRRRSNDHRSNAPLSAL